MLTLAHNAEPAKVTKAGCRGSRAAINRKPLPHTPSFPRKRESKPTQPIRRASKSNKDRVYQRAEHAANPKAGIHVDLAHNAKPAAKKLTHQGHNEGGC